MTLSATEMDQLCNALLVKFPTAPSAVFQELSELCNDVLGSPACPRTFPAQLINVVKTQLASQKKPIRDSFLTLSEKLICKMSPDVFWEPMQDSFVSKSVQLKEAALILIKFSLETFPEFKVAKMIRSIFSSLIDQSPNLRNASFAVAAVLYERAPETVEKVLRAQFLTRAEEILVKLKGDQKPAKKAREPVSAPLKQTEADNEASLIAEFDNPYPDTRGCADPCPFSRLEKTLARSTDWEVRAEGLEALVAHARGAPRADAFVRDLRTIQDVFVDCLTDNRSALLKQACLCLTALSSVLKSALDLCSDWLIPPLLAKTNNGTGVIAMSSALAVMRFVSNVSGRRIARILADNADNASVEVRVTVVKCMFVARDCWAPEMSATFHDILFLKQRDPSERVRALCFGIDERPIQPEAVIGDEDAPSQQDGDQEPEPEPEAVEVKSLAQLIQDKDTAGIERLIATSEPKPELIGRMQDVIDLVVMDLNEEDGVGVATSLLGLLCTHYAHSLYPFLNQLLLDLPEDEEHGVKCLDHLGRVFGRLPLARLLRRSKLGYANGYMLNVAEDVADDCDFQCRTILAVILNGFYEMFHNLIIFLLKRVYPIDPRKCEALFASIPVQDRNELLPEIQDQIPQLYNAFTPEVANELSEKLVKEIQKAKDGEQIDFELIVSVRENDSSNLLLALRAIRECQSFNERIIPYVLQCTQNKDPSVVGAAAKTLRVVCEQNRKGAALIAASFVPTPGAFKAFAYALKFAEVDDATQALAQLQDHLTRAIRDPLLKYSALAVIASATLSCGDHYKSFAGELSAINAKLLSTMMQSETTQ
jgi:hypothetical protein